MAIVDPERKRLLIVANRRGTKEMDLLLGGFAKSKLETMTEGSLKQFTALLDETDADISSWIFGGQPIPSHISAELLKDIVTHNSLTK